MSRLAVVHTRAKTGLSAPAVQVEIHLSPGLPGLNIVGLPEAAVRESKDRVRSALLNSGYEFPEGRVTINLAPADLPKEGSRFDLPIAIGILVASGQLARESLNSREFLGELALTGQLRPITGVLSASIASGQANSELVIPADNAELAALVSETCVIGANSLLDVCNYLSGKKTIEPATAPVDGNPVSYPDLAEVRGQEQAKRALLAAAAGGHHILFYGPPGTGKTMLASRLPGILPPLSETEALEVAAIHSLVSNTSLSNWQQRPFRNPHHSSSAVSLVGGGTIPRPGEVTFAHRGVLFLDELPEFQRQALEILREPLECAEVVITRARGRECFPASFQLVAAMNPCPCGYLGDRRKVCRCSPDQVARYRNKLSGPLLDRIDLQVEVASQSTETILSPRSALPADQVTSSQLRQQVIEIQQKQLHRQGKVNAQLTADELNKYCDLGNGEKQFISQICDRFCYSARAVHRILRVARTLADIESSNVVKKQHLAEAVQFRKLDRQSDKPG